jgi:hypothetical protein
MHKESKEFALAPRLNLVLKHLSAVRELDAYTHSGGLEKDVQGLRSELRQDLNRHLITPAGWEQLEDQKVTLFSRPQKRWGVVREDNIALQIYLALPFGDTDNPYVNLYVPANWKKRKLFLKKLELKAPQGLLAGSLLLSALIG